MTRRLHDKIRELLEKTPGLTQKGLAECMGLNPAAVNRMLYGRRNIMAEEIPVIESYIGQRLDLQERDNYPQAKTRLKRRGFSDAPFQAAFQPDMQMLVPVYAVTEEGLRKDPPVDWVARPPQLSGIEGGFGMYVRASDMAPRYFQGELVYIHPGRPVSSGGDCLVVLKKAGVHLRRVAGQDESRLFLQSFNPKKEDTVPRTEVADLYAVVGRA